MKAFERAKIQQEKKRVEINGETTVVQEDTKGWWESRFIKLLTFSKDMLFPLLMTITGYYLFVLMGFVGLYLSEVKEVKTIFSISLPQFYLIFMISYFWVWVKRHKRELQANKIKEKNNGE